jgi:peptidoglycan hydrolase CwlO-like protein
LFESFDPNQDPTNQNIEEIIRRSIEPLSPELIRMSVKVDSLQNKADNLDSKMTSVTDKTKDIGEKIDTSWRKP